MRFNVPQFIEIEDKIFGPLTWKQFLYVGGGFGMATVLLMVAPLWIFVLFGLPMGILAGLLAFYKVNNRPFSDFLEALYNYALNKKEFFWVRQEEVVYGTRDRSQMSTEENNSTIKKAGDLRSLTRQLELESLQKDEGGTDIITK